MIRPRQMLQLHSRRMDGSRRMEQRSPERRRTRWRRHTAAQLHPPVAHPATQPELCELCRGVVAVGEACCEPGCGCGAGAMHRACFEAATGFEECEPWMELVLEAGVIDACIDAWSLVGDAVDRLQDAARVYTYHTCLAARWPVWSLTATIGRYHT